MINNILQQQANMITKIQTPVSWETGTFAPIHIRTYIFGCFALRPFRTCFFGNIRTNPTVDVRAVIVRATSQRLRPVLLTTVTTVFGLLPLACGLSVDLINRSITAGGQMADFWAPLSQAIVFGLSFATLLTLIATPALLAMPTVFREIVAKRRTS